MGLIYSLFIMLSLAFAQETKIQKEFEKTGSDVCNLAKMEDLKSKITEKVATIACLRKDGDIKIGGCEARLIAGVFTYGIGKLRQIDANYRYQRSLEPSKVPGLLSNEANLNADIAALKNANRKIREMIEATDLAIERETRVAMKSANWRFVDDAAESKARYVEKLEINESRIGATKNDVAYNRLEINYRESLPKVPTKELTRDLSKAKLLKVAGGAATLAPAILDIGAQCNLLGVVTDIDEGCQPKPIFGVAEMNILYGKRLKELSENLPRLCGHFEDINTLMANRVEALKKMYTENVTYTHPICEPGKVSYNVNGNDFVKSGEVTLEFDNRGEDKKSLVKTGNLNYTTDYASDGTRQVVSSLTWESTDPRFPGRRQVTKPEIPSAMKQEVVERGMAFHILNQTAGVAAKECCANGGKSCEGFLPPKSNNEHPVQPEGKIAISQ